MLRLKLSISRHAIKSLIPCTALMRPRCFPTGILAGHFSSSGEALEIQSLENMVPGIGLAEKNYAPSSRKNRVHEEPKVVVESTIISDVERAFVNIVKAIEHMKPLNETFDIVYEMKEGIKWLIITTPRGKFQFHADIERDYMMFISYISGYHGYIYHKDEKLWLSRKEDQHDMRGMVTRDFIHHCVGCPDFNHMEF